MLTPLRFQPSSSIPGDAFRMLLECHQWMRSFSELAFRAASLDWLPERQRAEAFAGVERLEERLLFPEARARLSSLQVEAITAEMHARRGVRH